LFSEETKPFVTFPLLYMNRRTRRQPRNPFDIISFRARCWHSVYYQTKHDVDVIELVSRHACGHE